MEIYCFHNTLSLTFLLCLCLCFPGCFSLMSYNNSFCNFDIEKINFGAIQWRKQLKVFNIFHVFKKIYGIALTSCITECLLRHRCWSINYNNVLQYCELIDSAAETQSSLEITNSFIYTTKNDFLTDTSSCNHHICGTNERYTLDENLNATCVKSECGIPVTPDNSSIIYYGDQSINGKTGVVEYECISGFVALTRSNFSGALALCDENGWSYYFSCEAITSNSVTHQSTTKAEMTSESTVQTESTKSNIEYTTSASTTSTVEATPSRTTTSTTSLSLTTPEITTTSTSPPPPTTTTEITTTSTSASTTAQTTEITTTTSTSLQTTAQTTEIITSTSPATTTTEITTTSSSTTEITSTSQPSTTTTEETTTSTSPPTITTTEMTTEMTTQNQEILAYQAMLNSDTSANDGDHAYITGNKMSWEDGKNFCEGIGMILAKLQTEADFDNAQTFMTTSGLTNKHFVWIGLSQDTINPAVYTWTDGTSPIFTRWSPHEPDNENTEKCAAIAETNFQYDSRNCDDQYNVLCTAISA